ncbi:hypothetical protein E2C01_065475 [Portunus trituberculatus]|uniref:Ig-like domain-containing protein n=1 Tax=Portunus trituberculatus TaxID=210409 RepID=A0A5B7HLZ7_PORTR|nr:hypothetical protein [Portunus trituberculatus]
MQRVSTCSASPNTEAEAEILGAPEKHVKLGSILRLVCIMHHTTEALSYVFWYRGNEMINYESEEGTGEAAVLFQHRGPGRHLGTMSRGAGLTRRPLLPASPESLGTHAAASVRVVDEGDVTQTPDVLGRMWIFGYSERRVNWRTDFPMHLSGLSVPGDQSLGTAGTRRPPGERGDEEMKKRKKARKIGKKMMMNDVDGDDDDDNNDDDDGDNDNNDDD